MTTDEHQDALLALQRTLSGSAEALIAFTDCAELGISPPESLLVAAKQVIAELHRYVDGVQFDGRH